MGKRGNSLDSIGSGPLAEPGEHVRQLHLQHLRLHLRLVAGGVLQRHRQLVQGEVHLVRHILQHRASYQLVTSPAQNVPDFVIYT